ncbi:MAG: hypothetical protein KDD67_14415 [Ignavibacteriae bacterium]|nr:hypothetical protein [Ignavibacteriota bacterium]MCB9216674.1 hypothetical protein [Ignavibacteria bacterium]
MRKYILGLGLIIGASGVATAQTAETQAPERTITTFSGTVSHTAPSGLASEQAAPQATATSNEKKGTAAASASATALPSESAAPVQAASAQATTAPLASEKNAAAEVQASSPKAEQ